MLCDASLEALGVKVTARRGQFLEIHAGSPRQTGARDGIGAKSQRQLIEAGIVLQFAPRETARLILRPIASEDWPAIHRYMSDSEVTRWLPEGLLTAEQSMTFAARHSGEEAEAVAVLEKGSQAFVGHMVFHPWFGARTHEIGWVIARDHQGRGYATEAARSLLSYAFETLGCHRVIATCQPQNPPSWRVMEKLGMRREAHFLQGLLRPSGEWWDEYFYAMLAEEYFAGAARS